MDGASSNVDVNTLDIGRTIAADTGTPGGTSSIGTFIVTNGTLQVNTAMTIAKDYDTSATASGIVNVQGTFTVAGGNATIGALATPIGITLGNHAVGGNSGLATATVSLTGGTLNVFGNIQEGNLGAGTITSSLAINGASAILDMKGGNITNLDTITFTNGTIKNLGVVNAGMTLAGTGSRVFDQATGVNGTIQGDITGPGIGLTKQGDGSLTLGGTNDYGNTTVTAGTLVAGTTSAFGASGTITLSSGATLNLGGLAVTNNIINQGGTITGASAYAPTVAQTLSGISSYTGTVGGVFKVASGGTLKGNATTFTGAVTIENGGIHSPGASPGLQTFTAGISYDSGAGLLWEFDGNTLTGRGVDFDAVDVTGGALTITAGAKVKIDSLLAVDYAATDWDSIRTFPIVQTSLGVTTIGSFTLLDNTGDVTIAGEGFWSVGNGSGPDPDVILTWTPVPEPSTYAALAGLAVLGLAWKRRRRS